MEMLWHGTLGFGLVNVPIRLFQATRRRRIEFRLLHEPDQAPIRYLKVCSEEDRPVPDEEIVRGYAVDDRWIVLTDDEIRSVAPTLRRSIEIRDFVDLHEIDPILFRKPYYAAPDEGGEELYVMLREAIRRSGKVGVAQFVLLHREHLAVVRALGEALVVETLHYPEELIDQRELPLPAETRLREGEIRMAVELIRNLSQPFDASRYRNEYRAQLVELLQARAEGRPLPGLERAEPREPTSIEDLRERLRASLEPTEAEHRRRAA